MKRLFVLPLSLSLLACSTEEPDLQPLIIDPPMYHVIGRDSVDTGEFIGLSQEEVYRKLQGDIKYLNVVGNRVSSLDDFEHRLPLYHYVVFDREQGTEDGVQITLEGQKVHSIYLNSGKALQRWPQKGSLAVQVGESSAAAGVKLRDLQRKAEYKEFFGRVLLLVKDVDTAFDSGLSSTSAWFFTRSEGDGLLDEYTVHFLAGKVDHIIVTKMKK